MSVLVVAAHPDDEVLGCGGTIARRDDLVRFIWMGRGRNDQQLTDGSAAVDALRPINCGFTCRDATPDNRFDTVPLADLAAFIEGEISDFRPAAIFTHHPACLNIDHRRTAEAVLVATRPMAGRHLVREVLAFEVPSSTEWGFGQLGTFKPNVFVDITASLETKIQALRCYSSELRPFPHPRSEEAVRAQAARWGSVAGVPAAEAFELIRAIR